MKTIFSLLIMLCVAMVTHAQINIVSTNFTGRKIPTEELDSAYLKCSYSLRFVKDSTQAENTSTEEMILLVGKKLSKFFSYAKYQTDSLYETLTPEQLIERVKTHKPSHFSYDMFKNYPSGKITTTDKIAMDTYKFEEPFEMPNWEILSDTMRILGYACQKATTAFRGRNYVAWFTTDIPLSNGPWKFAGLPGLILNIADTRGHYVFECSGIETPKEKVSITMKKVPYTNVSKQDFNKVYQRYLKDPLGFVTTGNAAGTSIKVTMLNPDGTPAKDQTMPAIPYNPIELGK